MAVSTQHLRHQNLAATATTINERDVFQEELRSFTSGGGRAWPNQQRQPFTIIPPNFGLAGALPRCALLMMPQIWGGNYNKTTTNSWPKNDANRFLRGIILLGSHSLTFPSPLVESSTLDNQIPMLIAVWLYDWDLTRPPVNTWLVI